jgi:hypothetical protein
MFRSRAGRILRLLALTSVAASAAGACGEPTGGATPGRTEAATSAAVAASPTPAGQSQRASQDATASAPAGGLGEDLLALGTGPSGERGIWRLAESGRWSLALAAPTATAVARFGQEAALAGPGFVETVRFDDAPTVTPLSLDWAAAGSNLRVTAIARAPGGPMAAVAADADGLRCFVAAADGVLRRLDPAPSPLFAQSIAWLDDRRLLLLTTDGTGASQLREVDVAARSFGRSGSVGGVRDFGLSGDGATLVAVTAGSILAGSTGDFLGGGYPAVVGTVPDGELAWAVAVDGDGSVVTLVEAAVADDGTATRPHLVRYARSAGSWTLQSDQPLPLSSVAGLAWVPRGHPTHTP